MSDGVFDFSRAEPMIEDVVVRTKIDDDTWVDVLVTPSGRRALWNWSPTFASAEEARAWVLSVA